MDANVQRILDPDYLADLGARSIEEVRAMRAECHAVETGLSYLRRVVQGRLDIVAGELARRRDGGDPADLSDLIEKLPEILADRTRAPGLGRLPQTLGPGTPDAELEGRLAEICAGGELDHLPDAADDALLALQGALADFEHEVSTRRRSLFDRIDALQAELTRRYRTGEASVESLLR
jgi:hypothetical protein